MPRPGWVAAAICYELANCSALAEAVDAGAQWLLASANLDPAPLQAIRLMFLRMLLVQLRIARGLSGS
jgi:apolipoprotein N-acyltransferase